MKLVNDCWIGANADSGDNGWARATYHSGNMYHYRLAETQRYVDYTRGWAEAHHYGLIDGTSTRVADNQCAGQAYTDLYELAGGDSKVAGIRASLQNMVDSDGRDDWWWCDALHMAMPAFAAMGAHFGGGFTQTMYELYDDAKTRARDLHGNPTGLYNRDLSLWHRDNNYLPGAPKGSSPNGKPVTWSRGNGWVLAAHAKVLAALPADDPHRAEYQSTLKDMSAAIAAVQRDDGLWSTNLSDPDDNGGPESSGTVFFVFGMAYGISAGLLDPATYLPVVARGWNGLVATSVNDDGVLGYVQEVGMAPGPVSADHTEDYAVGGMLMAGSAVASLTS